MEREQKSSAIPSLSELQSAVKFHQKKAERRFAFAENVGFRGSRLFGQGSIDQDVWLGEVRGLTLTSAHEHLQEAEATRATLESLQTNVISIAREFLNQRTVYERALPRLEELAKENHVPASVLEARKTEYSKLLEQAQSDNDLQMGLRLIQEKGFVTVEQPGLEVPGSLSFAQDEVQPTAEFEKKVDPVERLLEGWGDFNKAITRELLEAGKKGRPITNQEIIRNLFKGQLESGEISEKDAYYKLNKVQKHLFDRFPSKGIELHKVPTGKVKKDEPKTGYYAILTPEALAKTEDAQSGTVVPVETAPEVPAREQEIAEQDQLQTEVVKQGVLQGEIEKDIGQPKAKEEVYELANGEELKKSDTRGGRTWDVLQKIPNSENEGISIPELAERVWGSEVPEDTVDREAVLYRRASVYLSYVRKDLGDIGYTVKNKPIQGEKVGKIFVAPLEQEDEKKI